MFKKGDYLTCNGQGSIATGLIIELLSDIEHREATIEVKQVGVCGKPKVGFKKEGYRVIGGYVQFRLATDKELLDAGIIQEPVENIPSSQIQFQSKTCGGTTYMQRMMHRIIKLREFHEKPRLTVMVLKGEMQQEVVNRVKKDVALLRKYTGYSSFITVRKEK